VRNSETARRVHRADGGVPLQSACRQDRSCQGGASGTASGDQTLRLTQKTFLGRSRDSQGNQLVVPDSFWIHFWNESSCLFHSVATFRFKRSSQIETVIVFRFRKPHRFGPGTIFCSEKSSRFHFDAIIGSRRRQQSQLEAIFWSRTWLRFQFGTITGNKKSYQFDPGTSCRSKNSHRFGLVTNRQHGRRTIFQGTGGGSSVTGPVWPGSETAPRLTRCPSSKTPLNATDPTPSGMNRPVNNPVAGSSFRDVPLDVELVSRKRLC
jgi:hypothetical protein